MVNKKHTYRLYTDAGLQVRTKRRKKLYRSREPMIISVGANQRWSMDFVTDRLSDGRSFRILNVVNDYSRSSSYKIGIERIVGKVMVCIYQLLVQLSPAALVRSCGTQQLFEQYEGS